MIFLFAGNAVKAQLVPIPKPVLSIPGRDSSATSELVFQAADIPPLGFLRFHIQRTANHRVLRQQMSKIRSHELGRDSSIKLVGEVRCVSCSGAGCPGCAGFTLTYFILECVVMAGVVMTGQVW